MTGVPHVYSSSHRAEKTAVIVVMIFAAGVMGLAVWLGIKTAKRDMALPQMSASYEAECARFHYSANQCFRMWRAGVQPQEFITNE
jgi:hypothetical protein